MAEKPLLVAVTSSSRHLLLLLRCISFAKKVQVRISSDGIRFAAEEGSVMEAFVVLEKSIFTSYEYNYSNVDSTDESEAEPPIFEISMTSLLEVLNIFALSDPAAAKRPGDSYDRYAAHRLNRHAGINAFSSTAMGVSSICTITYEREGGPLSIHMSEAHMTTTCDLTTYSASTIEEIPFNREQLALKTIMRSATLLDSINELSTMNPTDITVFATPTPKRAAGSNMSLVAVGALGSANVDFKNITDSALETFQCPARTEASFKFSLIKCAQRAMATASKVSFRLDEEGVLSLQFLIELERAAPGSEGDDNDVVAFVDFRLLPLLDDQEPEAEDEGNQEET
jgi:cell cycle checkpoint protein